MFRILTSCLLLAAAAVHAKTTCNTDLQGNDGYPYCVNVPDDAASGTLYPTVLFLSGRGARGPASDVASLSTYDGYGKLVSQYNGGSRDEASVLAATKFVTIVPVAPLDLSSADPQYWYPELLAKVLDHAKAQGLPIDWDRFHCAGYSMGAFGTWRFTTANPTMPASIVTSGGNAETNQITNTLGQQATPPAELLDGIVKRKIPIRSFTGTEDTTIPMSWVQQTETSLTGLGAASFAKLTILDTDHTGLSTIPFSAELLKWTLKQKRAGSKSSSGKKSGKKSSSKKGKSKSKSGKSKSKSASSSSKSSGTSKKCTAAQVARRRARRSLDASLALPRRVSVGPHRVKRHDGHF